MIRWSRKNLPNTRLKLDQFVRDNGLRPYGVVEYKGRDIFLAETDLEMDKKWEPGYELGYYQVAWFVSHPNSMEKLDVGSWCEFSSLHDLGEDWTPETKRSARLKTALEAAQHWIDRSEQVGRYDA